MENKVMMTQERRYPVGIQTFESIRDGDYVYVDKTDLMWQIQRMAKYIFLARPRRFGKSLLTTTFVSFFEGRKDLFHGLKVMQLEQEWTPYPVFHIDLSMAKGQNSADGLREKLVWLLRPYMERYGQTAEENASPGQIFAELIRAAYHAEERQVVVLIDEYDAPLLDVIHEDERLADMRHVMQEFYQPLKASEAMIRFCFITGITRFSQVSIFSTLNNLTNVSLNPMFDSICGLTEAELRTTLAEDIQRLARHLDTTTEEMYQMLKAKYDGYHFSQEDTGVYNPYSVMSALASRMLDNFWFESGTPTFLLHQFQHFHTDITHLDGVQATATALSRPTQTLTSIVPLMFQSGYLTIKHYDRELEMYTLAIPNQEVRVGLVDALLPTYGGIEADGVQFGFAAKFWLALKEGDIDLALHEMQSYFKSLPYIEGFKQKLADATRVEGFYEWTFYLIFSMLNVYVRTQVKTIDGRIDMVVETSRAIYVFELKINGTAREALEQIDSKGYAIPYQTDGRPVVKVDIRFSTDTLTVEDWVTSR